MHHKEQHEQLTYWKETAAVIKNLKMINRKLQTKNIILKMNLAVT